ncbi:hypothetical protein GCM10026982_55650 [Nocardiopsis aegyptia]
MGGRLHGRTTQVQGGAPLTQRGELADLSGTGVIEAQTHVVKRIRFPLAPASQTGTAAVVNRLPDRSRDGYGLNRIRDIGAWDNSLRPPTAAFYGMQNLTNTHRTA